MRKGRTVYQAAYLAGIIDGEGCFTYVRDKGRQKGRVYVKISNTDYVLLLVCQKMFADSGIRVAVFRHWKVKPRKEWKEQWMLQNTNMENGLLICKLVKPFLVAKEKQCDLAIQFYESRLKVIHKPPKHRQMTVEEIEIGKAMRQLNMRGFKNAEG